MYSQAAHSHSLHVLISAISAAVDAVINANCPHPLTHDECRNTWIRLFLFLLFYVVKLHLKRFFFFFFSFLLLPVVIKLQI